MHTSSIWSYKVTKKACRLLSTNTQQAAWGWQRSMLGGVCQCTRLYMWIVTCYNIINSNFQLLLCWKPWAHINWLEGRAAQACARMGGHTTHKLWKFYEFFSEEAKGYFFSFLYHISFFILLFLLSFFWLLPLGWERSPWRISIFTLDLNPILHPFILFEVSKVSTPYGSFVLVFLLSVLTWLLELGLSFLLLHHRLWEDMFMGGS